jgi:hypothetical protein
MFDRMMPAKIYPETSIPDEKFNNCFTKVFESSKHYKYKGDTASYASYRLNRFFREGKLSGKEIKLLLLDPREEYLFKSVAQDELERDFPKEELDEKIQELRQKIFVTLVIMFDLRQAGTALLEATFYKEQMYFRSEIMDNGIFLTYIVDEESPSCYFYLNQSLIYDSYLKNFNQNYNLAKKEDSQSITFNNMSSDDELKNLLENFGCNDSLENLRNSAKFRFTDHEDNLNSKW